MREREGERERGIVKVAVCINKIEHIHYRLIFLALERLAFKLA
jgi:hypothetical protein